jgi:hypothetical protein
MPSAKSRKDQRRLNLNLNPPSDRELKANANVFGRLLGQPDPLPDLNPVPKLNPVQPALGTISEPRAKIEPGKRVDLARGFLKLPNDLLDSILPMLDPVDAVLYLRLYRLSHGFGQTYCKVSLPTLANRCKCSLNTARRGLRNLVNAGLIKQTGTVNRDYRSYRSGCYHRSWNRCDWIFGR